MSTKLQEFFVYLADMFEGSEGQLNAETVKAELQAGGFDDVSAYDVREAVNLMYEEGDVFSPDQSSVLNAYTGGNHVDQSFNGSNIGQVANNATGTSNQATTATATAPASGGGSGPVYHAPPPPPMDPAEGYTDLDAAVEQIVYVSNITNNNTTVNNTTIDDRDVFEDNDNIIDNSVDQNILALGDVNQTFDQDQTFADDGGIAINGGAEGANLNTGEFDGIQGDTTGSAVVGNGNETTTLVGDNDGNVIGDDNDGNATGDGSFVGDGNAVGFGNVVGNENAIGQGNNTGDGNAFGEGSIAGDGSAIGQGNQTGDGNTSAFVNGNNDGVVNIGGEVEAIQDSNVGAAAFGDGDAASSVIANSNLNDSPVQVGEGNTASIDNSDNSIDNSDHSVELTFDASQDNSVDNSLEISSTIDNSIDASGSTVNGGITGGDVSDVNVASIDFDTDLAVDLPEDEMMEMD